MKILLSLLIILSLNTNINAIYLTNFKIKNNKVTFTRHYKKKKQKPSKDPFDIPDKYARKNSRIRRPKS